LFEHSFVEQLNTDW